MRPWEKEPVRLVVKHTFLEVESHDHGSRRRSDSDINYSSLFEADIPTPPPADARRSDSDINYSSLFDAEPAPPPEPRPGICFGAGDSHGKGCKGASRGNWGQEMYGCGRPMPSYGPNSQDPGWSLMAPGPPGLDDFGEVWNDDEWGPGLDGWQDWGHRGPCDPYARAPGPPPHQQQHMGWYGGPPPPRGYSGPPPGYGPPPGSWCLPGYSPGQKGGPPAPALDEVSTSGFPEDVGRTTVMLQNLPENYSRDMVIDLLDKQGFKGLYDFVYVPMNFRTKSSFGYAFINFISANVTKSCWEKLQGFLCWAVPSDRVCNMSWSVHQGLKAHIRRYRNSPVMHESVPDEYKPAVFSSGVRVPFPPPTKKVRVPRIRRSNQEDGEDDGLDDGEDDL